MLRLWEEVPADCLLSFLKCENQGLCWLEFIIFLERGSNFSTVLFILIAFCLFVLKTPIKKPGDGRKVTFFEPVSGDENGTSKCDVNIVSI